MRSLPVWLVGSFIVAVMTLALGPTHHAFAQDDDSQELPAAGGPLEPGRYRAAVVGPGLSFEVGDSWRLVAPLDGPIVVLERVDIPGGVLTITRFDGDTFADSCDPTSLTWVEPSAERLIDIIAGDPRLSAGEPAAIEVGGFPAISLEVLTPPLERCGVPYLLIWALPFQGGEFIQLPGQQARFIVLAVGPDVLVVAIETFIEEPFGFFASAAMEIVASLRIDEAQASPPRVDATPGADGERDADA
ncbi:hypothetical protein BH24CHL9_BH24CHL9_09610 [soil metagenome]